MEQLTLEMKNIEVTYLDRIIFEIPYLSVYQYDRIGIVGKNGSGKTTLLKLMYGEIYPLKGSVSKQIDFGYFEQKKCRKRGKQTVSYYQGYPCQMRM